MDPKSALDFPGAKTGCYRWGQNFPNSGIGGNFGNINVCLQTGMTLTDQHLLINNGW